MGTTTIPCPGGGSISFPGGKIPSANDVEKMCKGSLPLPVASMALVPGRSNRDPRAELGAAGFGSFIKTVGRAVGGVVKDIIPGQIDDKLIDRLTGVPGRTATQYPPIATGTGLVARGCPPGYEKKNGQCVETGVRGTVRRVLPGGQSGTLEDVFGDATMGRYGVALVPSERVTSVLDCPPGMKLGKDNLCYDSLRKSERKWPPGRKPLMTGGDLNAITRATRAARRLKRTQKRLKGLERDLKKVT